MGCSDEYSLPPDIVKVWNNPPKKGEKTLWRNVVGLLSQVEVCIIAWSSGK